MSQQKSSPAARAREDRKKGLSTSTQAGEFVRDEIDAIREGKHGARSAKQAIAIGLSRARRAGVKLSAPKKGRTSAATRHKAELDDKAGRNPKRKVSAKRSRATVKALKREPRSTVSRKALSKQTKTAAKKRTAAERSASARKAARTRAKRKR
jgi:hypothetical protein